MYGGYWIPILWRRVDVSGIRTTADPDRPRTGVPATPRFAKAQPPAEKQIHPQKETVPLHRSPPDCLRKDTKPGEVGIVTSEAGGSGGDLAWGRTTSNPGIALEGRLPSRGAVYLLVG